MPVVLALGRLRKEDLEFKLPGPYVELQASLDYIVRPFVKKRNVTK
jgi:hypothetical protein